MKTPMCIQIREEYRRKIVDMVKSGESRSLVNAVEICIGAYKRKTDKIKKRGGKK